MVLASAIFSPQWSGKVIQFKIDNAAVIQVIEATCAQNAHLMYLLLLFFTSYYDLWFTASHIAISLNTSADALSRNNMAVFFLQVPGTGKDPIQIPNHLCLSTRHGYLQPG